MVFGSKKPTQFDQSQDKQLQDLWKWVDNLHKRLTAIEQSVAILNKNNTYFIEKDKILSGAISQLQAKDRAHDQKDAEIEAVIAGLKNITKAVESTQAEVQS